MSRTSTPRSASAASSFGRLGAGSVGQTRLGPRGAGLRCSTRPACRDCRGRRCACSGVRSRDRDGDDPQPILGHLGHRAPDRWPACPHAGNTTSGAPLIDTLGRRARTRSRTGRSGTGDARQSNPLWSDDLRLRRLLRSQRRWRGRQGFAIRDGAAAARTGNHVLQAKSLSTGSHLRDAQAVLAERSGLVEAHDVHPAQRFHRTRAAHQRPVPWSAGAQRPAERALPPAAAPRAPRQRQRPRRWRPRRRSLVRRNNPNPVTSAPPAMLTGHTRLVS